MNPDPSVRDFVAGAIRVTREAAHDDENYNPTDAAEEGADKALGDLFDYLTGPPYHLTQREVMDLARELWGAINTAVDAKLIYTPIP